jgi:hypothetical protein
MSEQNHSKTSVGGKYLKFVYLGYVLFGMYLMIFRRSFGEAAIYLGIALAFDPFDPQVSWKQRPIWQRAALIIHLAIVAACLGYEIGRGDK